MKLIFPNGEHEHFLLQGQSICIGSNPDCDLVLGMDGIAPKHAKLIFKQDMWSIEVDDVAKMIKVNGTQIKHHEWLKQGDAIEIASTRMRLVDSIDYKAEVPVSNKATESNGDGRTVIRTALPHYSLRGVSGEIFGKTIPLHGTTIIGRQDDCDVVLQSESISRQHVKITVRVDGVEIEDLGSANGTFVNGKRVSREKLKDGDEVKLDTLRLLFQAPPSLQTGAVSKSASASGKAEKPPVDKVAEPGVPAFLIVGSILVLAAVVVVAYLFYSGQI